MTAIGREEVSAASPRQERIPLAILYMVVSGIVFAAVYLLWMCQRVIFGPVTHPENRRLADLSAREWAVLVPALVLIVWIGVYPVAFTGKTEASVGALIAQVQSKAAAAGVRAR